jgi:uncharacterized protein YggE
MPSRTITIPVPGVRVAWLAAGLAAAALIMATIGQPALTPRSSLAADPTGSPTTPPDRTLSVSGTGKVTISPDIADLRLGVSITKPTVKDARTAAAQAMTAVLDALRKAGVADADLKTTVLALRPVYDYSPAGNPPKLTGYNLSNAVIATIRNLDQVPAAVDGALGVGATTMDGITFRVADPAAAEAQARKAAMTQARAKADVLASSAGVTISGVASIQESSVGIPISVPYAGAAPSAKDVSTPVEPGTNDVTVTVGVVYLIR